MILSMTGFGKATGEFGNKKISVEVKSLNSKQSDIQVRMSSLYREKEMDLRSLIFKTLKRGKIEANIFVENNGGEGSYSLNKELATRYFKEVSALANELNLNSEGLLSTLVKMPDVMKPEREELSAEEAAVVYALVDEALDKLTNFREDEGAQLAADFKDRIASILSLLEEVEVHEPKRVEAIRARIEKNLNEWVGEDNVDKNRQEQELIFYLEKLDITEEKVRLRAHCKYFLDTMASDSSEGKKLGFIAQEIGREINTIGSKANQAEIQRAVVQMKDELEKIKEQVLNVL